MIHKEPHPKAGQVVKIHAHVSEYGGRKFRIEDWWDRVGGGSWKFTKGNSACLQYAARTGFSSRPVPNDDEVVYGKIGGFGYIFHVTELNWGKAEVPIDAELPPEAPADLPEWLWFVHHHQDEIYVRHNRQSVPLSSLSSKAWAANVARWLEEGHLPLYIKSE